VPHFWAQGEAEAGLTDLGELIARHAETHAASVRPAVAQGQAEPDPGEPLKLVTLEEPTAEGVVEFLDAAEIKARHHDAFAVRIDGQSMAPDILHGDLVVLSPSCPAVDGKPAVVQLARQIGVTCKLLRREGDSVHLVPINEQLAPQTFGADQVIWALRVLARVRPA
jgi:hypothetical protein